MSRTDVTEADLSCPSCGRVNEVHAGQGTPQPGDVSVCYRCGGVAFFTDGPSLRVPTPEERAELDADPGVQAAVRDVLSRRLTPRQVADRQVRP